MTAGMTIRVPLPALTEENRKKLVRMLYESNENERVRLRNIRREALAKLKELLKSKSISEDEDRRAQGNIQQLTDDAIAEADKMTKEKEADLMAV